MDSQIPQSGNEIIDSHHLTLNRIVGKLAHAWMSNLNESDFNDITKAFLDSLNEHFEAEITIIRAAGFKKWQTHQNEHNYILNKLNRILQKNIDDFRFRFIDEAERTLFEHELLHDQEYWEAVGVPLTEQLIVWDDSLLVHDEEIDKHHKALVGYLNRLYDWICHGQFEQEVFLQNLTQLYAFTKAHFKHEEECFNLNSRPSSNLAMAHMRDHARLLSELRQSIEQFKNDANAESTKVKMRDFIRFWLVDHIVTLDKPCFEQLNNQ